MVVILVAQVPVTLALGWLAYRMVGRTFDSAFMAAGFYGFMIGTTFSTPSSEARWF